MKRFLNIAITLILFFGITAFIKPDIQEKKIDRIVNKVWKKQNPILEKMEVSDSLLLDVSKIYKVKVEGQLVGYACYATAFGCRIGGCAAPSNPNAQSYETFDYIVIYDLQLNILKIDIANYGGEYGYEICRASWLKQFEGNNSGFVLNENIDGITGATVSAQYLIDDLNSVGVKIRSFYDSI